MFNKKDGIQSMAKILITGGAGFIGSHLAKKLLDLNNDIVIFDNLDSFYSTELKNKNLESVAPSDRYVFIRGDIRDYTSVCAALDDVQVIIHEAAQPGIRASLENPMKTHETNISGTLNILRAAVKKNIKRVIIASSSSVYGDTNELPYREEDAPQPLSPYGVSKLASDHYAKVFNEVYGLSTVSLRYFSVYGPRIRPDLVLPIFTNALVHNKKVKIFGDGEQSRDFTYIEDIVEGTLRALTKNNIDGETFNIASGERTTINKLYNLLCELVDRKSAPIHETEKKGEVRHTHANINKARKHLGYKPRYNIQKGLKKFIDWYQNNNFYLC
jgi:UDP-glucose 4-epimerase